MPEKYHIKTQPVPPRRPRTGKCGVRRLARRLCPLHNCVRRPVFSIATGRNGIKRAHGISVISKSFHTALTMKAIFPYDDLSPKAPRISIHGILLKVP